MVKEPAVVKEKHIPTEAHVPLEEAQAIVEEFNKKEKGQRQYQKTIIYRAIDKFTKYAGSHPPGSMIDEMCVLTGAKDEELYRSSISAFAVVLTNTQLNHFRLLQALTYVLYSPPDEGYRLEGNELQSLLKLVLCHVNEKGDVATLESLTKLFEAMIVGEKIETYPEKAEIEKQLRHIKKNAENPAVKFQAGLALAAFKKIGVNQSKMDEYKRRALSFASVIGAGIRIASNVAGAVATGGATAVFIVPDVVENGKRMIEGLKGAFTLEPKDHDEKYERIQQIRAVLALAAIEKSQAVKQVLEMSNMAGLFTELTAFTQAEGTRKYADIQYAVIDSLEKVLLMRTDEKVVEACFKLLMAFHKLNCHRLKQDTEDQQAIRAKIVEVLLTVKGLSQEKHSKAEKYLNEIKGHFLEEANQHNNKDKAKVTNNKKHQEDEQLAKDNLKQKEVPKESEVITTLVREAHREVDIILFADDKTLEKKFAIISETIIQGANLGAINKDIANAVAADTEAERDKQRAYNLALIKEGGLKEGVKIQGENKAGVDITLLTMKKSEDFCASLEGEFLERARNVLADFRGNKAFSDEGAITASYNELNKKVSDFEQDKSKLDGDLVRKLEASKKSIIRATESLEKALKDFKPKKIQTSEAESITLSQVGIFSPSPRDKKINLMVFIIEAEKFSKKLRESEVYKNNEGYIADSLKQLDTLVKEYKDKKPEEGKEKRDAIREKIKEIEEIIAALGPSEKKGLAHFKIIPLLENKGFDERQEHVLEPKTDIVTQVIAKESTLNKVTQRLVNVEDESNVEEAEKYIKDVRKLSTIKVDDTFRESTIDYFHVAIGNITTTAAFLIPHRRSSTVDIIDPSRPGEIKWDFDGKNKLGAITLNIGERTWQEEFARLRLPTSSLLLDRPLFLEAHRKIYDELCEALKPIENSDMGKTIILQGVSGLGKTYCAQYYFYHQAARQHQTIAWLSGATEKDFEEGWKALAQQLRNMQLSRSENDDEVIKNFCEKQLGQWLFIIDDMNIKAEWLINRLPQRGGHVLITTHQHDYLLYKNPILLRFFPLSSEDSRALLRVYLGQYWKPTGREKEEEALRYLSEALGGFTVALNQIALLAHKKRLSFERVCDQFKQPVVRKHLITDTIFDQLKGQTFIETVEKGWRQCLTYFEENYKEITSSQHNENLKQFVKILQEKIVPEALKCQISDDDVVEYWQAIWLSLDNISPLKEAELRAWLQCLPITYDSEKNQWELSLAGMSALEFQSRTGKLPVVSTIPQLSIEEIEIKSSKEPEVKIPFGVDITTRLKNSMLGYGEIDLLTVNKPLEIEVWQLPTVNPYYIPRPKLTGELFDKLPRKKAGEVSAKLLLSPEPLSVAAATGMGGIGKTELARHFITEKKFSEGYQKRFWFTAETESQLRLEFLEFATYLRLVDSKKYIEDEELIAQVHKWLNNHPGWLMILDNADNYDCIAKWVPKEGGAVMITTRQPTPGELRDEQIVHVPLLEPDEAVQWLYQLSRRNPDEEKAAAKDLVEKLGFLPLAIAQAAAYLREQPHVSIQDYLTRFESFLKDTTLAEKEDIDKNSSFALLAFSCDEVKKLKELVGSDFPKIQEIDPQKPDYKKLSFKKEEILKIEAKLRQVERDSAENLSAKLVKNLDSYARRVVFSTWELSLKAIEETSKKRHLIPLAEPLLSSCAYFAPKDISVSLLEIFLEKFHQIESSFVSYIVDEYIGQLARFSLLERFSHDDSLSIHRLVQQVIKNNLSSNSTNIDILNKNIYCLCQAYPKDESKSIHVQSKRRLLPHLNVSCNDLGELSDKVNNKNLGNSRYYLADAYLTCGDAKKSKETLEILRNSLENVSGEKDDDIIGNALLLLSNACEHLGLHEERKKYLKEALLIIKEPYRENYINFSIAHTNFGDAFSDQDRKSSEENLRLALKLLEDKDPYYYGITLNVLGKLYCNSGRHKDSKEYCEEALNILKKTSGENHYYMANVFYNLGNVYLNLGKLDEAEEYANHALKIDKDFYGENHFQYALTTILLGCIYCSKNKLEDLEKSEDYIKNGLKVLEEYYKKDCWEVGNAIFDLSKVYLKQKLKIKQKKYIELALEIYEKGHDSKSRQEVDQEVDVYKYLSYIQENKELFEHIKIEDPKLYSLLVDLGNPCLKLGNAQLSKEYLKKALSILKKESKIDDQKVSLKQKETLERALKIYESHYGNKYHPEIAPILVDLSAVCNDLGYIQERKDFLKHLLNVKTKNSYPEENIAKTLVDLGNAYLKLGNTQLSKEYLEKALSIFNKKLEIDDNEVATNYYNQGMVYIEFKNFESAREYFNKAIFIYEKRGMEYYKNYVQSLLNLSYIREGNYFFLQKMDREQCQVCYQKHDGKKDPSKVETHRDFQKVGFYEKNDLSACIEHIKIIIELEERKNSLEFCNLGYFTHIKAKLEKINGNIKAYADLLKEAKEYFEESIKLNAITTSNYKEYNNAIFYTKYAQFMLRNLNNFSIKKIEDMLNKVLELNQKNAYIYYRKMDRLTLDPYLQNLIDIYCDHGININVYLFAHYLLIQIYLLNNQVKEAEEILDDFRKEANNILLLELKKGKGVYEKQKEIIYRLRDISEKIINMPIKKLKNKLGISRNWTYDCKELKKTSETSISLFNGFFNFTLSNDPANRIKRYLNAKEQKAMGCVNKITYKFFGVKDKAMQAQASLESKQVLQKKQVVIFTKK